MHAHSHTPPLPAGASECAGHALHAPSPVAPTAPEYLPAPQSMHAASPVPALYLPAPHPTHGPPFGPVKPASHAHSDTPPLPAGASECAGHALHVPSPVAPTASEYLPAPQSSHAASPVPALYLPAPHSTHGPPFGPVKPASQIHADTPALPAGAFAFAGHAEHVPSSVCPVAPEYLPAPQYVHAASPAPALYLPAAQSTHGPPFGPVKPASQIHPDTPPLPAGASEFAGHVVHVPSPVAPTAPEYLPAPQSMHAASPVPALYLPAPHPTHGPPFGPVKPASHAHSDTPPLPAGASECAGHALHVPSPVAPTASEYLPAPQSSHAASPVPALYLPAPHPTHGPPSPPVNPALHVQFHTPPLPAGASECAGHAVHALSPVAPTAPEYLPPAHAVHPPVPAFILYVPSTHAVHVPPSDPVYPLSHLHADKPVLPAADIEFAGQSWHATVAPTEYLPAAHCTHVDCDVAPIPNEYDPLSQRVQFPSPAPSLYVPAPQLTHAPPPPPPLV